MEARLTFPFAEIAGFRFILFDNMPFQTNQTESSLSQRSAGNSPVFTMEKNSNIAEANKSPFNQ